MPLIFYILCLLLFVTSCQSQTKTNLNSVVGGPCEGCEGLYEFGDRTLNTIDTIRGFFENEPKLKIEGTIFLKDGRTPAQNVILYAYHTNRSGIYETIGNEKGWARRHGIYRGWIKTDSTGKYTFYTFRPAAYPGRQEPEHIHLTVKEPTTNAYYIDEIVFDDDPLLTASKKQNHKNRGGSGITKPIYNTGFLTVERNIILGLNIPGYD